MELNEIFPSKYIKAADLQGRDIPVVISHAVMDTIGDDRKLIVYFQGKDKGMVMNKTNANRIAHLYGSDTDGWAGKEITLYTEMVDFQGKVVDAIRVKAARKTPEKKATASTHDDEIPF